VFSFEPRCQPINKAELFGTHKDAQKWRGHFGIVDELINRISARTEACVG
jgi:hypothetical protein